jgi:molybdopterin molybdotransferase
MDGYAINFDQNNSLSFDVVGSILAGSLKVYEIKPGEAIEIMTGGKIPKGTNAVIPIELTEISQ